MFFTLFHWFIKITGFLPMLVILRNRIHYEDRAIQGRKIKGGAIVVANHNVLMDFAVLLFTFPFNTLRCVGEAISIEVEGYTTLVRNLVSGRGGIC